MSTKRSCSYFPHSTLILENTTIEFIFYNVFFIFLRKNEPFWSRCIREEVSLADFCDKTLCNFFFPNGRFLAKRQQHTSTSLSSSRGARLVIKVSRVRLARTNQVSVELLIQVASLFFYRDLETKAYASSLLLLVF